MNMKRRVFSFICFQFSSSHKMNQSYQKFKMNKMNNKKEEKRNDLEPIINQGRKKKRKILSNIMGLLLLHKKHTNTLTADRSKAINRRTRIRRQQSTMDTEITETTINDGHKGNNQRHRRTRRQ